MRRFTAAAAACLIVLSACSSNEEADPTTEPSTSAAETASADPTEPESVEPVISDEGMPTISEDKDGNTILDFDGATDPGQLQVAIDREGDGEDIEATNLVVVDYVGQVWGSETPFDSSYERGTPNAFNLGGLIPGWRDALVGQKVGSRVIISIPPELGYGPMGGNEGAGIGPEDTIAFVVEVHDVLKADEAGDPEAKMMADEDELPVTMDSALGEAPKLTVKEGATAPEKTEVTVIAEGNGEKVGGQGTTVYLQYAATTWDNSMTENSIDQGGVQNATVGTGEPWDLFEGIPEGSRVLILTPAQGDNPAVAALFDVVGQVPSPTEEK
ncbi:MAG: FKBP-type peptidyl-prolyl cis-trans isomerase [Flaviflexus sp.]|nr:FKBP-type peptidyl-prolyl cis-trans isomerase [Flaviflexus sp.]